ncbi:hydrolase 2, exosortase A system-associated [Aromatoleum buckelii]|uniref:Hydrolase 2, exosortase A system-associated n=1 Tax=Aromatoleum buckelii TaxID=200254 RepID=A0ABX1N3D7_9RHOO|nr:hydrolase 2, exosortase A system-associated [Aromatoleum buckelii]MCK0510766.1 hydrolase 2, exosortase A system-associated [Aromatoleum buckelii]
MPVRRSAFFLPVEGGEKRFCLVTAPEGEPRGAILYVHPFAEEMNKSRRMAALASWAFAERGWMVLQADLGGCGDSTGDFGDATWPGWLIDVDVAWRWLRERADGPAVVWSLRAGSLVVSDWLKTQHASMPLLLWQPVINGRQHLTQFLRVKGVSRMMEDGDVKATMAAVRAELHAGHPVEIAGYTLSPDLVGGLEKARLELPSGFAGSVASLEVVSSERPEPTPAVALLAERWRERGGRWSADAITGPGFWQTVEIEVCPTLIDASVAALKRVGNEVQ